jgi:hypothetical protein
MIIGDIIKTRLRNHGENVTSKKGGGGGPRHAVTHDIITMTGVYI